MGEPLILALDAASPTVSVAVADRGRVLSERSVEIARSSKRLLELAQEALTEAGATVRDATGFVALAGPGSFTGLRVGLATVLGLHQALGTPAAALPTLDALAAAVSKQATGRPVVAAVDVLRGEWVAQRFSECFPPRSAGPPERLKIAELADLLAAHAPVLLAGFGVAALEGPLSLLAETGIETVEPPPLAGAAALLAARHPPVWDASLLTSPLYFRPPAVTLPKRR